MNQPKPSKVEVEWSATCTCSYNCSRFSCRTSVAYVREVVCTCGQSFAWEAEDRELDIENFRCDCGVDLGAAVEASHVPGYLTEPWDIF